MAGSFQMPEDGLAHQDAMPDVPPPEALKSDRDLRLEAAEAVPEKWRRHLLRARPIEIRPVAPRTWFAPGADGAAADELVSPRRAAAATTPRCTGRCSPTPPT